MKYHQPTMKVFVYILLFIGITATAQTTQKPVATPNSKDFYKQASDELNQMLTGQKKYDFKRAVFVVENAYQEGKLSYTDYCKQISDIGIKLKKMIADKHLEKFKTAPNWATFTYMMDTIYYNDSKPYTYDFDDFMGDKSWTSMFVTKLMSTKSGNCHSLPYLYKILCNEIGGKASLALAPNHVYIKHIDENGQWTNLELTNGSFSRDQWIIQQMAISVEAIKSKAYMNPLSEKENIAMCLFDLAQSYERKYGKDKFELGLINTGIQYFPNCIELYMMKTNYYREMGLKEKAKQNPDKTIMETAYSEYKKAEEQLTNLGYKDMPAEQYQAWVKSVETEKEKRDLTKQK